MHQPKNHEKCAQNRFLLVKYTPNLLKINTKVIKIHLVGPKIQKFKKFQVWKNWKKIWSKTKKELISMHNSSHNIARCIILFSFNLYNQFLWKNSRTWDFSSQSWDTQYEPYFGGYPNWPQNTNHARKQSQIILGTASTYGHVFGP